MKSETGIRSEPGRGPAVIGRGGKIRVLLADDYPLLRFGIRILMEREDDLLVCGTAADPAGTLEAIASLKPDVALIAFSLRSAATFALIREARLKHGGTPLLVLSFRDDPVLAKRVSLAGAKGFVARTDAPECVIEAVRRVARGLAYLSSRTSSALGDRMFDAIAQTTPADGHSFTEREKEILELIGGGSTPREIAQALQLSVKTVESHRENIKQKLGIRTAAKLGPYAFQWAQNRKPD